MNWWTKLSIRAIALPILLLILECMCSSFGSGRRLSYKVELGRNGYTEYQLGTNGTQIILTSEHGGKLRPPEIPDRKHGCWNNTISACVWRHGCESDSPDSAAERLTKLRFKNCNATVEEDTNVVILERLLADEIGVMTGQRPHVIISHLHRTKLDANRNLSQATFHEPLAVEAWNDFNNFIRRAKTKMKTGLVLDIHGQSHPEKWIELGYMITADDLNKNKLNPKKSSIRSLAKRLKNIDFKDLLSGKDSLGKLLQEAGHKTVPSPKNEAPGDGGYFSGFYVIDEHGSMRQGEIDGIMIESPWAARDTTNIEKYAKDLAQALVTFTKKNYEPTPDTYNLISAATTNTKQKVQEKIEKLLETAFFYQVNQSLNNNSSRPASVPPIILPGHDFDFIAKPFVPPPPDSFPPDTNPSSSDKSGPSSYNLFHTVSTVAVTLALTVMLVVLIINVFLRKRSGPRRAYQQI